MPFVQGVDGDQLQFVSLHMLIAEECQVRIINAFVDRLDLGELGFKHATAAGEGRPAYDVAGALEMNSGHFLLRDLKQADGEVALISRVTT